MPKINLLYVITKLELGGAQKQLLSLISGLDKERFNVFLFTAKEGLLLPEALSIGGLRLERSRWLERPINPFKDLLAVFEIYRFIKNSKIQIVHTHSSKAGILGRFSARLAKVKFIYHTVHGWSFNDFQPVFPRTVFIHLERFVARFTDKIIIVSFHDKQKGLNNHIADENKFQLIRYGIDYNMFTLIDRNIREELGIGKDDLAVGMVSCLKPQKSPGDFIKLASLVHKKFPEARFILVGDGPLRKGIQKMINKLGLNSSVVLTGWRWDIERILSAIDICVLTSLWEGLPVVALEALASSKPVVATNTGGIAELIVDGKNGFLVSIRDMQGMSDRVSLLLKDANLRGVMSLGAKISLGVNFTLLGMIRNHQDLYLGHLSPTFKERIRHD